MIQHHPDFQLAKSGLIISTGCPFIGASSDGLVLCSCCGEGCVEIKCPFDQRDNYISEAVHDNICLTKTNNSIKLLVTHQYHYQTETQIYVTKSNFCDFFVWTKKGYYLERVYPDENIWSEIVFKCNHFF